MTGKRNQFLIYDDLTALSLRSDVNPVVNKSKPIQQVLLFAVQRGQKKNSFEKLIAAEYKKHTECIGEIRIRIKND